MPRCRYGEEGAAEMIAKYVTLEQAANSPFRPGGASLDMHEGEPDRSGGPPPAESFGSKRNMQTPLQIRWGT